MPEHVYLPLQKFKELVDYTKRTNDIITGFIKKKPKHERTSEPSQELSKREPEKVRKRKSTPQKPHSKSKKPRHTAKLEIESQTADTATVAADSSENSGTDTGSEEEDAF